MQDAALLLVLLVLLLIVVFREDIYVALYGHKRDESGASTTGSGSSTAPAAASSEQMDGEPTERSLSDGIHLNEIRPGELTTGWEEIVSNATLDPEIYDSQMEYANARQKAAPATELLSVADDNTSPTFTAFSGFSRPQFVPTRSTATQVQSEDTEALLQNRQLRW